MTQQLDIKKYLLDRRIYFIVFGLPVNVFELIDTTLGEGKHADIFIMLAIPALLKYGLVQSAHQLVLIFLQSRSLLIIVASISWVQAAYISLPVNLIAVKYHNHTLLYGLLVLVQEKQEVDLVVR
jgi:hypothetical protein